jgi:Glycosyltransferase family 10 (fucosyltransferase) C-term
MIRILISRNYEYPDFKRQTPGLTGRWGNIEFTEDQNEKVDFIVVFNQPSVDIKAKALEGGSWLFLQEPPYTRNEYFKYHFRFADKIISGFDGSTPNNIQTQAGLPWHINLSYDELKKLNHTDHIKENRISWITSNNNMFPGHQPRIDFIDFLKESNFDFDLFGRGFQPIDDKFEGLKSYKYSIAVENYSSNDYWTEKAIDCMLSWTIPLYYGCTNMEKYFPKGSFINVDITNKQKALDQIAEIQKSNYWEENLDALAEARELILDKYQIYPLLSSSIEEFMKANPSPARKMYRIPKSGLTPKEEVKKKLSKLFRK